MIDCMKRREALALDLLKRLKQESLHIKRIIDDLGDSSGEFLQGVYRDHSNEIQEKIDLFNKNIEAVKDLNLKITGIINEWYLFTKSEDELKRLIFPLRMLQIRKKARNGIHELKKEITAVGIRNRLIREDIRRLESSLELEAAARLKKDVRYEDYLHHLNIKSLLIKELQYLLPTLGMTIRELDIDKIDDIIALFDNKERH